MVFVIIEGIGVSNYFTVPANEVSAALAKPVKNTEPITAITFRLRTGVTNIAKEKTAENKIVVYHSSKYGTRMDTYVGGKAVMETYILPVEKAIIITFHQVKKYIRILLTDEQLNQIYHKDELIEIVKRLIATESKKLGRDDTGNLTAECIKINCQEMGKGRFENAKVCVWIDLKTKLPIRIKMDDIASGKLGLTKMVIDDFQWNKEFEQSKVKFNIPTDYVMCVETKLHDKNEYEVIDGLSTFAELLGDRYPSSLALTTVTKEIAKTWEQKKSETSIIEHIEKIINLYSPCLFYA